MTRSRKKITHLEQFQTMLTEANILFTITDAKCEEDRGCRYVKVGSDYSYAVWKFDDKGLLKSQDQFSL